MINVRFATLGLAIAATLAGFSRADVTATVERLGNDAASPAFPFHNVPTPAGDDLASNASFSIVDGVSDGDGAKVDVLHDGRLPSNADDPRANFFFGMNTLGGRLRIDLGRVQEIGQINTYSWHTNDRAPQVYTVYAARGEESGFQPQPKLYLDPAMSGWEKLCTVDTREPARRGGRGQQIGVSLNDNDFGTIGSYRYLLFDVQRTDTDAFANTFFSEIDVIAPDKVQRLKPTTAPVAEANRIKVVIDTTGLSPEMTRWAHEQLEPVCKEWYPKLVAMLPSDGYRAPRTFTITFSNDMGNTPAAASGTHVSCNLPWFEHNQQGEGIGAVVHEMVHVVQQYHFGAKSVPFWLQEGIPDYIRWYLYEPEKNGARIRDLSKAKYDGAYRISANFLNYVCTTYGKDIVPKVNAAIRMGQYTDAIWPQLCKGKTLTQLDADWKEWLRKNQPTTAQPTQPGR